MTDQEKRDAAVDAFAKAMKERLNEMALKGKTGWDGGYPTQRLRTELRSDANDVVILHNDDKVVDIANRAMMLWYRDGILKQFDKIIRGNER